MTKVSAKKVLIFLLSCIAVLLILNITSYINVYANDLGTSDFFFRKFNFDKEKNVPSSFSSILHLIASTLLFWVGFRKLTIHKNKLFWFSLSILFLFLGFDELLRIHEKVGGLISRQVDTSGIFYYSWVIPYGILVIVLGFLYLKPLLKLPKKTVNNFIIAGCLFLSGAVGLEMLTGWYIDNLDVTIVSGNQLHRIIPIFIFYTFEESLEMLGVTYFIFELVRFQNMYSIDSNKAIYKDQSGIK